MWPWAVAAKSARANLVSVTPPLHSRPPSWHLQAARAATNAGAMQPSRAAIAIELDGTPGRGPEPRPFSGHFSSSLNRAYELTVPSNASRYSATSLHFGLFVITI